MDQEIEAQAKEFLAFLEQCSQQSRAKATSEINSCQSHLTTFLTNIQPLIESWPETNDPAIESKTVHASEMYPTLGPLLEHLCRNPVILASSPTVDSESGGSLAELVAKSVIRFSSRNDSRSNGSSATAGVGSSTRSTMTRMAPAPSAEQLWRAARMRDMFRAQPKQQKQLDRHGKKTTRAGGSNHDRIFSVPNGSRKVEKDLFQELFKVSDKEMKDRETELTLETMANNLKTLQDQVVDTELTEVAWNSLVEWNRQLSGLCAPLVSTTSAAKLLEGIIRTTYLLYSKYPQSISRGMHLQLLDSSFVESLMLLKCGVAMPAALKEVRTLAQFLFASSLARQGFLVQLIDAVIQECGHLSDFYQSQHQITQHFESSHFLASALSRQLLEDQHRHLIEKLLGGSAELVGEVDDWRIVRIWILLVGWILKRLGSVKSLRTLLLEPDTSTLDQDTDLWAMISSACRIVNSSHSRPTGSRGSRLSVSAAVLSEISSLMEIQCRYIFETAPPQEMALRRRMVFLVGSTVAMNNGLLTTLIHSHILSLDKPDHDKQDPLLTPSQNSEILLNLLSLLMCGETGAADASAIGELFLALLKDMHAMLRVSETSNPYDLRLGTIAGLEVIFVKYLPLLRMNVVVTADIVCAVVIYNDPEDSAFWQSVISAVLRILTGQESTPPLTSSPAYMARLRDLSEIFTESGLSMALESLLATPATIAAGVITVPMNSF
ncbi:MAG: hypothetical protein J3R72DRAFT_439515 [Linnemannia gamsii]|nr:MAG: hypothetical protein J3R72DRAFT_439515 [Linnemannia gamsii]